MKAMVFKTFLKVIGFISLSALFLSIIECDLMNMIGCIAFAAAAWWCWSLRKAPLV